MYAKLEASAIQCVCELKPDEQAMQVVSFCQLQLLLDCVFFDTNAFDQSVPSMGTDGTTDQEVKLLFSFTGKMGTWVYNVTPTSMIREC